MFGDRALFINNHVKKSTTLNEPNFLENKFILSAIVALLKSASPKLVPVPARTYVFPSAPLCPLSAES
jgi:hypothetical protein